MIQPFNIQDLQAILYDLRQQDSRNDLGKAESIEIINQGKRNATYGFYTTLPDGKRGHFVLSVTDIVNGHGRTVDAMMLFQHYLYEHKVPVPKPIGNAGTCQDGRRYAVTEFMEGQHVLPRDITAEQMHNLGRALALFHQQTAALHPSDFKTKPPTDTDHARPNKKKFTHNVSVALCRARFFNQLKEEPLPLRDYAMIRGRRLVERAKHRLGFKEPELPKGFLHGDLNADNILFCGTNNAEPCLIDLGLFHHDTFLKDIIHALRKLSWQQPDPGQAETIDPEKIKKFLDGYNEVRPLTVEEKKALPDFLLKEVFYANIKSSSRLHEMMDLEAGYPDKGVRELRQWREICSSRNQPQWLIH